jgi:predicted O-methyltransferase YrrM
MSTQTLNMPDVLHRYLLSVSVPEDALGDRLRRETQQTLGFNMQISPEQAQFMTLLLKLLDAKTVLEVGTFTGYSALIMARALPPSGRLVACDVNRKWTDMAQRYWREAAVHEKIDLRLAPALDTLQALHEQGRDDSFDFAFIDADKGNYTAYFDLCLQLVRPGGIVAVDNTLWGGAVADPDEIDEDTRAIRALNSHVFSHAAVVSSLVPIGDGLHLAFKRVQSCLPDQ